MDVTLQKNELLEDIITIAQTAGDAILKFYRQEVLISTDKTDGTPLTEADLASHSIIVTKLQALTPETPIISEENKANISLDGVDLFWLVDPLDGTKEFINKNGDFTVNIALIENGCPILGVVYAPALNALYVGDVKAKNAFLITINDGTNTTMPLKTTLADEKGMIVVGSRSHNDPALMDEFLKEQSIQAFVSRGSSLKFCLIAEGKAHLYPRLGRTMEWDTAAGQAVLEAAGGKVTTLEGLPLLYGKVGLDNPHFVAMN